MITIVEKSSLSSGILAKMKEGAENVHTKLQAKAESVGLKPLNIDGKGRALNDQDEKHILFF